MKFFKCDPKLTEKQEEITKLLEGYKYRDIKQILSEVKASVRNNSYLKIREKTHQEVL